MNPKKLLNDEDAVSPVIGVILMVAITVILAAVIASFVLGLGEGQQQTPSASFDFDYDSDAGELTITHSSGDELDGSLVTTETTASGGTSFDTNGDWSGDVSSGDSVTLTGGIGSGETITIVWTDSDEETSSTLAEYEIP